MSTDITLTLPCPLCSRMLTAIYEPADTGDLPLLAEVNGCDHADRAMMVLEGAGVGSTLKSPLWEALHHAILMDTQDRHFRHALWVMDRLEQEED